MKITQAATVLNTVINEMQWGEIGVVTEDLSNIVDIGKAISGFLGSDVNNYESFTQKLIDQVGKVKFWDRNYRSQAPNILKDSWEYGSILQKVRCELPEAADNESWSLKAHNTAGTYPDPFVITLPDFSTKFFNKMVTYEIPITITEIQLKEALRSAQDYMRLVSMIENRIDMKKTLCNDGLIMTTITNLAGQKITSGKNIVDVLELWNTVGGGSSDSKADAVKNPEFWRFVSMTLTKYKKYLAGASQLYNDSGYVTFTPAEKLKFVMLTEYAAALKAYLYSTTYHDEYVRLDGFEEVGYWQGSGTADDDRFIIDVQVENKTNSAKVDEAIADVLAIMFDEEAAVVCNENDRVTTAYNPRGEYFNSFVKWDARYLNDIDENVVVFTIGAPIAMIDSGNYQFILRVDETVTTTAYPAWDSTYAVASSDYYLYDPSAKSYTRMGTSDKTTDAGFDGDSYIGNYVVKKLS